MSNLTYEKERLVVQLQEQISTRTNIIIASNAFLFMPFVSLITGSTPVTGYFVWIPMVVIFASIGLNGFWLYATFKQIDKRDNLVTRLSLESYFKIPRDRTKPEEDKDSAFYDFFNKAAPILMIVAWLFILGFYLLQKII